MKAMGIDLGTTNSVAAYCEPGQVHARVLENSRSERWTPSAVSATGDRDVVGTAALNNAERAPQDTIVSVKRLMGRVFEDPEVATVRDRVSYQLSAGEGDDPRVHVMLRGKPCSPASISATILRKIKEDAGRKLGAEVTHAVITVPAYFEMAQREATREAGVQAGLVVKRVLDEPTAAAIAFGVEVSEPDSHRILVFDLGGGTFDVSILQMVLSEAGKPQFVVLDYVGDNWLGGDDFDYAIVDRIVAWVKDKYGEDPSADWKFRLLAKRYAEQAKKELSELNETQISIPAATKVRGAGVDVEITLTRAEFQDMIEDKVTRTIDLVNQALRKQQLGPEDISDVLLVGGATMTPLVYERVEGLFGSDKVRRTVNPMECVAQGAATLAANTSGVECPNPQCRTVNEETAEKCSKCEAGLASARAVGQVKIDDVTGMSFGIRTVRGTDTDVFAHIIPSGTPYPLRKPLKRRFQATGRRIKIPVFQGEDPVASHNSEQGSLDYELPEDFSANSPVDISLNFDRNGIITVMVSVPNSDFFEHATLRYDQPRTGKSDSEPGSTRGRPEDELTQAIEFANRFIDEYGNYLTAEQVQKLRGDISRAWEGAGGPRIAHILLNDIYSCEVAFRLFSADQAVSGATPKENHDIAEAAMLVRQAWDRGDQNVAREKSKILNAYVKQSLDRRAKLREVATPDHGGLLRLPDD